MPDSSFARSSMAPSSSAAASMAALAAAAASGDGSDDSGPANNGALPPPHGVEDNTNPAELAGVGGAPSSSSRAAARRVAAAGSSPVVAARSRGAGAVAAASGGGGGGVVPSCQVERCNADMGVEKRYNRRHKVCDAHRKASVVLLGGLRQRFCQQCSRFHELSHFDDTKRSCRLRLAGHNERRRRNPAEAHDQNGGGRGDPAGNHHLHIR